MTFRRSSLRRLVPVTAAAVALGATVATAAAFTPGPPAAAAARGPFAAMSSSWSPAGGPPPWAPTGAWSGAGGAPWGPWSRPAPAHAEYFHVMSTKPSGPGAIIVTGVVNAGGTEHPGRAIDQASFNGGTFRIDHSAGRPTTHFDAATCVGTITQAGPFEVIDATGQMRKLTGSGHYVFRALYTTAKAGGHCTSTMTAYTETIDGEATVHGS